MVDCVIALNYYSPYVSGLTNVARDVAEGLSARGHRVTVVTSQHEKHLPLEEELNGVRVVRCPVNLRFGKGVVSAGYVGTVVREAQNAQVVSLQLPMLEAGVIASRLKAAGRRSRVGALTVTYHCDVSLPPGLLSAVQRAAIDASSRAAANAAEAVVVTTDDYADASRLSDALARNRVVIPPGCHTRRGGSPSFRETTGLHVGFLGRLVEEKGIEYLVRGFSTLRDPDARLLIGGDFAKIAGGSVVDRVRSAIGEDPRIRVLGFIDEEKMDDFYASMDVFALTSVNSFEAFGIVQVEAMIAGVPALASDLPGVRQPVRRTGFGVVVPPRDADAIGAALRSFESSAYDAERGASESLALYSISSVVTEYENLFGRLVTS